MGTCGWGEVVVFFFFFCGGRGNKMGGFVLVFFGILLVFSFFCFPLLFFRGLCFFAGAAREYQFRNINRPTLRSGFGCALGCAAFFGFLPFSLVLFDLDLSDIIDTFCDGTSAVWGVFLCAIESKRHHADLPTLAAKAARCSSVTGTMYPPVFIPRPPIVANILPSMSWI